MLTLGKRSVLAATITALLAGGTAPLAWSGDEARMSEGLHVLADSGGPERVEVIVRYKAKPATSLPGTYVDNVAVEHSAPVTRPVPTPNTAYLDRSGIPQAGFTDAAPTDYSLDNFHPSCPAL